MANTSGQTVSGGPLVGVLVVRNPRNTSVKFGDTISFTFKGLKNAGKAPLEILKIQPMNDNMTVNLKTPFTLQPGQTFDLTANQKLVRGGTSTEGMDVNGVVNYEQTILITTNGKKKRYQIFCRQELIFFDGNRE